MDSPFCLHPLSTWICLMKVWLSHHDTDILALLVGTKNSAVPLMQEMVSRIQIHSSSFFSVFVYTCWGLNILKFWPSVLCKKLQVSLSKHQAGGCSNTVGVTLGSAIQKMIYYTVARPCATECLLISMKEHPGSRNDFLLETSCVVVDCSRHFPVVHSRMLGIMFLLPSLQSDINQWDLFRTPNGLEACNLFFSVRAP